MTLIEFAEAFRKLLQQAKATGHSVDNIGETADAVLEANWDSPITADMLQSYRVGAAMPSLTYREYCAWFHRTYGRPFAASEAEFLAALAQPPTPTTLDDNNPRYLDGEEDREGLYR
jgi:hypothetical protein